MKSKKTDDVARLDVLAGYILVFLLGRYPDEPTKEDYLNLVKHIRGLEAKIEQHTMEYERMAELIRY